MILFRDKSLRSLECSILIFMMSVFIFMALEGVTSFFSHKKNLRNTNFSQSFGRDFVSTAKTLEISEEYTCVSSFLVRYRNRVFLHVTSDLLPNISLVVGQLSVNISPALRARDVSTSRLTSKQWYIRLQNTTVARIYFLN